MGNNIGSSLVFSGVGLLPDAGIGFNSDATLNINKSANNVLAVQIGGTNTYKFQSNGLMLASSGARAGGILDSNGTSLLAFSQTTSAVDYLIVTNGAAGNPGTVTLTTSGNDTNISLSLTTKGSGTLSVGTSNQFAVTGNTGKVTTYGNVATVGWGTPSVYGDAVAAAQTGANASVATYTVGGSDGAFLIGGYIVVTTYVSGTVSMTVAYTDPGNTARTATMAFEVLAGTTTTTPNALGSYEGQVLLIRCKASTAITIATTVAALNGTYTAEGTIIQVS